MQSRLFQCIKETEFSDDNPGPMIADRYLWLLLRYKNQIYIHFRRVISFFLKKCLESVICLSSVEASIFNFFFFSLHREMKSALMDCRWTCYSCLSCQSGSLSYIFFSFLQNFTHRKKKRTPRRSRKEWGPQNKMHVRQAARWTECGPRPATLGTSPSYFTHFKLIVMEIQCHCLRILSIRVESFKLKMS